MPKLYRVEPFLLANSSLLARLEALPFSSPLKKGDIESDVFVAYHHPYHQCPDHVFRARWKAFLSTSKAGPGQWVQATLQSLANSYLETCEGRVVARFDTFPEWQSILCHVSSVAVVAAMPTLQREGATIQERIKTTFAHSPLVYPHDAAVEDYIQREKLHETHLHLNGSTFAELCWQRALRQPRQELAAFMTAYARQARVRELCQTIAPDLSAQKLLERIKLARAIRSWLLAAAHDKLPATRTGSSEDQEEIIPRNPRELRDSGMPFPGQEKHFHIRAGDNAHWEECHWLGLLLKKLAQNPDPILDRLLHLYLLIQHQYQQLLIQRDDWFGFDQFQKLTLTELREPAEKEYLARFRQMHRNLGPSSRGGWLEGRFAPKSSIADNERLLLNIFRGYARYLADDSQTRSLSSLSKTLTHLETVVRKPDLALQSKLKLTLVTHFIKQDWDHKNDKVYRHHKLRQDLFKKSMVLLQTLRRWPKLQSWLRGIDAAANELHAPPEVFAPIFRVCRAHGIQHFTYHAGEDFAHLLCGIRQIAEAMNFLDLCNGNRIGHGTAVGIQPELWLARMPEYIILKRGDWMLDLLNAWQYLRADPTQQMAAAHAASEASRLASLIFEKSITIEQLHATMNHRGLWPDYVLHPPLPPSPLNQAWRDEAHRALTPPPDAIGLLRQWWSSQDLWQRSEEAIDVKADFLAPDALLVLQQSVMKEISLRRVVIETLPTSNVRISQYESFHEHHALRWMKVPGHVVDADPEIMVSLGSDDPGIFCNDLSTDFYQLYQALRKAGLNDADALEKLANINERGRSYRFHHEAHFPL